ncbi:hypothetical protein PR048_010957 [Dryococelus australis]|uniref:Uncharacterized protein n=1 Tax=Dryococelus australis TaxID=614101 RepID=A0ABQ9HK79_9NEOP|nr:hypothetical protein PR048_010957 [Dryococelus australis]
MANATKIFMLTRTDIEEGYFEHILFTDEAMFHVLGLLNRHNIRIWGSKNSHASQVIVCDSPKFNTITNMPSSSRIEHHLSRNRKCVPILMNRYLPGKLGEMVLDINNLKQRFVEAIATTDVQILQQTWKLLAVLHVTNAECVEVY